METSNLSSAWWLIAIVLLVIVTRVVLYYQDKAKRKDKSSKRLSDKVNITREQLANISGKQFEAYANMKPSFELCSKSIDISQTKQEKPEQNMKKLSDDYNANSMYVLSSSYATQDSYSSNSYSSNCSSSCASSSGGISSGGGCD